MMLMTTTTANMKAIPIKNRNRRQKYIVRPNFQIGFATVMGLAVFITSSTISLVLFGVLHQQARLRMMNPESYVANVPLVVFGFALLFSLVAAGIFAFWCLIVTHRVCGPLQVLHGYFEQLARGHFPQRRPLRKRDEFKDLFEAFWEAVEALEKRCNAESSV